LSGFCFWAVFKVLLFWVNRHPKAGQENGERNKMKQTSTRFQFAVIASLLLFSFLMNIYLVKTVDNLKKELLLTNGHQIAKEVLMFSQVLSGFATSLQDYINLPNPQQRIFYIRGIKSTNFFNSLSFLFNQPEYIKDHSFRLAQNTLLEEISVFWMY
jgi:hypothetical protein